MVCCFNSRLIDMQSEDSEKLGDSRKFTTLVHSIAVEIQPEEGSSTQESDRTEVRIVGLCSLLS